MHFRASAAVKDSDGKLELQIVEGTIKWSLRTVDGAERNTRDPRAAINPEGCDFEDPSPQKANRNYGKHHVSRTRFRHLLNGLLTASSRYTIRQAKSNVLNKNASEKWVIPRVFDFNS